MLLFFVLKFFREYGYVVELNYVEIVVGWYEVVDDWGIF